MNAIPVSCYSLRYIHNQEDYLVVGSNNYVRMVSGRELLNDYGLSMIANMTFGGMLHKAVFLAGTYVCVENVVCICNTGSFSGIWYDNMGYINTDGRLVVKQLRPLETTGGDGIHMDWLTFMQKVFLYGC